jgi:hypothetical protein
VVEDEGEAGQLLVGPGAGGQLVREHDQVVDEPGVGDGGQSAADVRAQQPLGVGFALDLVADALEVPAAGEGAQAGAFVGDVGPGEVGPADDAPDQVVPGGQGQELRGLLGHGDGLHEDRAAHPGTPRLGFEVLHREVASQRGEFGSGDPVLVADGQVPHVVVGVDHGHDGSSHTTGRPASAPPSE